MENLEKIDVPTLIVLGAGDQRYKAGGDYMASKIPDARKVVIENAGHAVNLYQPDEFNAAVLQFLRDNEI
jgi:pimeloyl-ACP methyl ester carboxylesterase